MKISERSIVNIGSVCNINCKHCYYYRQNRAWKSLLWILANILLIRICRMKDIDITGGEPSIYPHIDLLVWWCEILGFREIRLVTNGVRYRKLEQLSKRPRVRFSVSIHSHIQYNLYRLTGHINLYELIHKFIFKCSSRINYVNCVITPYNTDIENILDILKPFKTPVMLCIKALDYHYDHAIKYFKFSEYRIALNNALRKAPENQRIDIRFFPFCVLDKDNFERKNIKCCSSKTNVYDPMDWNPVISREAPLRRWLMFIFGSDKVREKVSLEQALYRKTTDDVMVKQCFECSEKDTCDGIQNEYLKKFGDKEFIPFCE